MSTVKRSLTKAECQRHVKVGPAPADIFEMTSPNCAVCGSGLPDFDAHSCAACGARVEQPDAAPGAAPAPLGPPRRQLTEDQWRYVTWGAVGAGAVAVVALVAVVFGLLSRSDSAEAAPEPLSTMANVTTSSATAAEAGGTMGLPVSEPVLIEYPRLWSSNRYNRNGAVVALRVTLDVCDRRDGMLHASGSIRNDSLVGQALDYRVGVDLTRAVVGTPLGSVEAVVTGLGPGETADWLAEKISTKAVSLRCEVVALTVSRPESE